MKTSSRSRPPRKPSRRLLARTDPKVRVIKRQVRRAQPIHKRVLLHPITVLLLLCVGVFMVCWTYRAVADNYSLTAKVAAAPLGQGALITSPADGTVFTEAPITVSGTCPVDSYVKLTRNGTFSGIAFCTASGTFEIETDLFEGQNVLLAQDYNVTDDPGPATPSITVTYNPPHPLPPPSPGGSPSGTSGAPTAPTFNHRSSSRAIAPLLLTSDFKYQTFLVGSPFKWEVRVQGGVKPYTIQVTWGDGATSTQAVKTGPAFDIMHTYKKPGYYVIIVRAQDAAGSSTLLELAGLAKTPGSSNVITTTGGTTTNSPKQNFWQFLTGPNGWLWVVWPSFVIVMLIVLSFWLGERQEYHELLKRRHLKQLRPRTVHR